MIDKNRPSCPNHGEALEGLPFPLPRKGSGICPVSGVPFDFIAETDEESVKVDKNGHMTKQTNYRVEGDD